ncbi:polymorphic toxin type 8 domain-containing protein [Pedobacter sp. Leaf176]|uniref:polymorphic toxin type 8 domain-containing protein n=1 Tax=Pedobacter sp. Leaf176 TaxID=1736286 RepID=UPI0006F5A785|nr:polymorphic toxin type 8 domain-containing protein [Pedobacter sp. Leaf176]KQR70154.1 hypothetical protein ASF92_09135 [Pedobacter sp. Leaf176]
MSAQLLKFLFTLLTVLFIAGPQTKAQMRSSGFVRGKGLFGSAGAATKTTKITPSKVQDMFPSNEKMFDDKPTKSMGRNGKYNRMKVLMDDPKTPGSQRGWLKQEQNAVKKGKRTNMRMPIGYDLAHPRGLEAQKGYDHRKSKFQSRDLHRMQHKIDKGGRKQVTQAKALESYN